MFQPMETNPFQDMMDISQIVAILSGAANSMTSAGNTEVSNKIGTSISNLMDDFDNARTKQQEPPPATEPDSEEGN